MELKDEYEEELIKPGEIEENMELEEELKKYREPEKYVKISGAVYIAKLEK
jgi:hypothetical protein